MIRRVVVQILRSVPHSGRVMLEGAAATMRRMFRAHIAILLTLALLAPSATHAQRARPAPLAPADVDAIVQLVKLEDTRSFEEPVLTRLVKAANPEVRRRATVSIGRIADPRGRALLTGLHGETSAE